MKEQQMQKPLRNSSAPFTILLGRDDYYLEKEVLLNIVDEVVKRKKEWHSPGIQIIHFKKGVLKLKSTCDKKSCELDIGIEKDKLHIACSCQEEVETLCIHAFRTLDKIAWYNGSDYFGQFRPGGLYEMSKAHKKYFKTVKGYNCPEIKTASVLRTVYALSDTINFDEAIKSLDLLYPHNQRPAGGSDVLCYMIVNLRRKDHPPFVVPCLGRLTKDGTAVKGFHSFLTGLQQEHDLLLSDEQKLLNNECLLLYKEAEKLPGRFFPRYYQTEVAGTDQCMNYLNNWEKVLSLLKKQRYVFVTGITWKRELKKKPSVKRTNKVLVSLYRPRLSFLLTEKKIFFRLQMKIHLPAKIIHHYAPLMLFLLQDDGDNLYLFGSVTDAYLAEWFHKAGNRLTIFKEHFRDFEKNFLSPLALHYEIKRVMLNRKK